MLDRYQRRYDNDLKDMIFTVKEDYAGYGEAWPQYQPNFYITACGTKHHHNEMYDPLFLQYVSQMLATTGDRSLRLSLEPSEEYSPWQPGFFARRLGDALVVTHVFEEKRLRPGDVITAVNGLSPAEQRTHIQKNFFYSDLPEREIWHGLLKMADHAAVQRKDGGKFDMPLAKYPRLSVSRPSNVRQLQKGAALVTVAAFDGSVKALLEQNRGVLAACDKLIIDLRRAAGDDLEDILPLLNLAVPEKKDAAEVLAMENILTNYTAKNCACLWYPYEKYMEANGEDAELRTFVNDVKSKSGAGWLEESDDRFDFVQGVMGGGGRKVVLLTDTWCENAAELFVMLASRQGAEVIGRPTMGTLDYCSPVSKALDEDFVFTYPISKRKSVLFGGGVKGVGLPVDEYIPFSAEETERDVILQKAIEI